MRIHHWLVVAALCSTLELPACRSGTEGPAPKPIDESWTTHEDPAGFSVSLPRGWKAHSDGDSGRIDVDGTMAERLVVWPFFADRLLAPSSASELLSRIAPGLWPASEWESPEVIGATSLRSRGRVSGRPAVAVMSWDSGARGTAGYVYAASAPESRFRESEGVLARVFEGFRLGGGTADSGSREPSLKFVRWQDPTENAFTLEVPEGWVANGGIFRPAPMDPRSAVEITSPDGDVRVVLGDARIPRHYLEPNPIDDFQGYTEGTWKPSGYGSSILILRYRPGAEFAREYVQTMVAPSVTELVFTDTAERPDMTRALNQTYAEYASYGIAASAAAGEVTFTCRSGARSLEGYYVAVTTSVRGGQTGTWSLEHLYGYVADGDRADTARAVLAHAVGSVQVNPQWLAREQQDAAAVTRIVARTTAQISQMMFDLNRDWERGRDEAMRRTVNAIAGTEDVVDPETGEQLNVVSGSSYYWIDGAGTVAGTDAPWRPDVDFREMIRLP